MSKSWFNYCLDYFMPCVLRDVHLYFFFFAFFNCIDENCVGCGPTHC